MSPCLVVPGWRRQTFDLDKLAIEHDTLRCMASDQDRARHEETLRTLQASPYATIVPARPSAGLIGSRRALESDD